MLYLLVLFNGFLAIIVSEFAPSTCSIHEKFEDGLNQVSSVSQVLFASGSVNFLVNFNLTSLT